MVNEVKFRDMADVERNVRRTLRGIWERKEFDLERFRALVSTEVRKVRSRLKSDISWFLEPVLRRHHMYDRESDQFEGEESGLKAFLNDDVSLYLEKPLWFWEELAREVFDRPAVVLRLMPSRRMLEK